MTPAGETPELDVRLVEGFGFACRPDCGLCCYAEPRVEAVERRRLLSIVPETEFVARDGGEFLEANPEGGACRLLADNRCRAHSARPHPCREFPLTAHVGARLQATVVLSCPGVDLAALRLFGSGGAPTRSDVVRGFDTELAALRERVDPSALRRLESSARRRRKIARLLEEDGRWEDDDVVRGRLRGSLPLPGPEDFPAAEPPSADDGIDALPLFFDGRNAPVTLAAGLGGWELRELAAGGGFARSLGVIPPPTRPPELHPDAAAYLEGYLRYWLERDALFGTVHLAMIRAAEGTVSDWVAAELRAIGALVLARAEVRAKLARGVVDRLSSTELLDGVRASDQDLLDRETWGDRL